VLADTLRHIPPSWTFAQAASLGATLPVSYGALKLRGALRSGEVVLVHAAAGGLGLAAVQLASALGCRVIGTAGSVLKCSVAEKSGAEACVDYSTNLHWWEEVQRLTNGRGVDLVFDPVGLVSDSLRCLAHRGRLLVVGFAGREGDMEQVKMNRVLLGQATIIGYVCLFCLIDPFSMVVFTGTREHKAIRTPSKRPKPYREQELIIYTLLIAFR
jgi:NADPH:quinone reductase